MARTIRLQPKAKIDGASEAVTSRTGFKPETLRLGRWCMAVRGASKIRIRNQ